MSQLIHDILGKITIIKAAVWDAQNQHPETESLSIAATELDEIVKLIETIKTQN